MPSPGGDSGGPVVSPPSFHPTGFAKDAVGDPDVTDRTRADPVSRTGWQAGG
jgi:hypothetical protein